MGVGGARSISDCTAQTGGCEASNGDSQGASIWDGRLRETQGNMKVHDDIVWGDERNNNKKLYMRV